MVEVAMGRPTIVAIDDEMEFTKTIAHYFQSRGYTVHSAVSGLSGLELVDAERPDVVLIDLKMPGIDGDEALVRIRQAHPKTQVIVITAYSDEGRTKERVLSLGAFAHFEKPLSSMRHLAEAVEQAAQSS
jgi:CheY-like chemotaxis protein